MESRSPSTTPQLYCLSHKMFGRFRIPGTKNYYSWPQRPGKTQENYLGPRTAGPFCPTPNLLKGAVLS